VLDGINGKRGEVDAEVEFVVWSNGDGSQAERQRRAKRDFARRNRL
jgi:hypothetical protein